MRFENGKKDLLSTLSWFSESFSRPSFKLFTSFIISFIQLGKEVHTSSMVRSLTFPFLHRSLPSFTRFLGQNRWAAQEVAETPVYLVCTNLHLPVLYVIQYYARRWKIEQMIKDLKQRLGLGDYQVRNLHAIQRHVALLLLSYFVLMLLKALQRLRDKIPSQIYRSVD